MTRSSYIERIPTEPTKRAGDSPDGPSQLEMRQMSIANRAKNNYILETWDERQDQGIPRYYSSDGRSSSWSDDPIHAYRMDRETAERMCGSFNDESRGSDYVACQIKRLQINIISAEEQE